METAQVGSFTGYLVAWLGGALSADDDETAGPVVGGHARPDRPGLFPPDVTRGVMHEGEVKTLVYGLDWMRATFPESRLDEVTEWACRRFGNDFEDQMGFGWYSCSRRWPGGLAVGYGQKGNGATCCVELTGSVLGRFTAMDRVEMVRELLELGAKFTRLDVAIDQKGEVVRLVELVGTACFRGKLCGARTWRPDVSFGPGGECTGQTIYIGKRGKEGSGRYVRCYDKGLESGESPANTHHRWEAEFSAEVAHQVAVGLSRADDPAHFCAQVALGAVTFKDGESRRSWSERPDCHWWAQFKAGVRGVRFTAEKRLATLAGRVAWLKSAAARQVAAMAQITGSSMSLVWREIIGQGFTSAEMARTLKTAGVVEYAISKGIAIDVVGAASARFGRRAMEGR